MSEDNPAASNMPFAILIRDCGAQIAAGHIVFQKVTCAGCGARIGIEEPNRFYTKIRHDGDDSCGHVTDCEKTGGGYMLSITNDRSSMERIYGKIPSVLTVVEVPDGPQESGRKDRVEGVPPSGACS